MRFVHGDFVEIARDVPAADIVALDRVIRCYPDMEAMVARASLRRSIVREIATFERRL